MYYTMKNSLIAGLGRHAHIKPTNDSIRTKLTHLKIISSFTLKVSIASNNKKCTKKINKWSYCRTRKTNTTKKLTLVFAVTGQT